MIIKKLNSTSKQDYNYPTFIGHKNAYISLVNTNYQIILDLIWLHHQIMGKLKY